VTVLQDAESLLKTASHCTSTMNSADKSKLTALQPRPTNTKPVFEPAIRHPEEAPMYWSHEELEELALVSPRSSGAARRFHEKFPHHSLHAIRSKLQVLRQRGSAPDVEHTGTRRFRRS
jgi:hypothetical protein